MYSRRSLLYSLRVSAHRIVGYRCCAAFRLSLGAATYILRRWYASESEFLCVILPNSNYDTKGVTSAFKSIPATGFACLNYRPPPSPPPPAGGPSSDFHARREVVCKKIQQCLERENDLWNKTKSATIVLRIFTLCSVSSKCKHQEHTATYRLLPKIVPMAQGCKIARRARQAQQSPPSIFSGRHQQHTYVRRPDFC